MPYMQSATSIVHDVLDEIPETAFIDWGRKVDMAEAIVQRLRSRGGCVHSEDCGCFDVPTVDMIANALRTPAKASKR